MRARRISLAEVEALEEARGAAGWVQGGRGSGSASGSRIPSQITLTWPLSFLCSIGELFLLFGSRIVEGEKS